MKKYSDKQRSAAVLAELRRISELKKLCDKYLVSPGSTAQQVFDAFVAVEQSARPEYMLRAAKSTGPKRQYWFQKASGLTTAGGQNRLKKLLTLARKEITSEPVSEN